MTISLPTLLLIVAIVFVAGVIVALLMRRSGGSSIDHGAHVARSHGRERSPQWPRVEHEHRQREPACAVCGYKGKHIQVHHIKPFHLHPHLELEPSNLITLCSARGREHHLLLGHLDSWHSYNEHIREDAKHFHHKSATQIRADIHWQKKMALRP